MAQRICIIGLAKSGTSALYGSIKAKLPAPRRLMFEPSSVGELAYVTERVNGNALTKLMFSTVNRFGYDPARFTHNVAIVRDPRDVIVSTILFSFNRLSLLNNKALYGQLVSLFEKKERDPRAVTMVELLEASGRGEGEAFRDRLVKQLQDYQDYLSQGKHHIITFDDMIEGRFDAIDAYLGFALDKPQRLEGWISKISRKGESGDWMRWFCPEDVEFFKESLAPFMRAYGFSDNWDLEPNPVIEPEHCSQYIRRLADARLHDPNREAMVAQDEASLWSAAEDGKVNAIRNLIQIFTNRGATEDEAKIADLNEKLGQMGYPKHAVQAGRYFIRNKDRSRALAAFRNGEAADYALACRGLAVNFRNAQNPKIKAEAEAAMRKGAALGDAVCQKLLSEAAQES